MELFDRLELQITRIRFSDVETNLVLADTLFEFVPLPDNVDVVGAAYREASAGSAPLDPIVPLRFSWLWLSGGVAIVVTIIYLSLATSGPSWSVRMTNCGTCLLTLC